ncbi:MAG: hypothetical protein R6U44_08490 [Archaeoglobaceae archaeon]
MRHILLVPAVIPIRNAIMAKELENRNTIFRSKKASMEPRGLLNIIPEHSVDEQTGNKNGFSPVPVHQTR